MNTRHLKSYKKQQKRIMKKCKLSLSKLSITSVPNSYLKLLRLKLLNVFLRVMNLSSRDPEKVVRPRIPLTTCIKNFGKDDVIDGFYSTALERNSVVRKYAVYISFLF